MQLSIIIVNFNTNQLLKQVITSITKKKDWEIIVVDNDSKDNSVRVMQSEFPDVKLIQNTENKGFAKANNQGIKIAKGKYILLLNSDTKMINNAIEKMLNFMDSNPKIGISSCQLLNQDGSIQPQGGYFPTLIKVAMWMSFIDDINILRNVLKPYQLRNKEMFKKEIKLDWVSGTAMVFPKDLIEKIGMLNEDFFMYGEDVEFCIRARNAGYQIALTPTARIVHLSHRSSGGEPQNAWIGEYKAVKYIFKKYKPSWQYPIVRILLIIGALLRMLIFGILQGRKEAYAGYKKAFQMA